MHRAWIAIHNRLRAKERAHVVVLGFALCMWMIAFATHIHADADDLVPADPSSACSFCLSLPTGATAPAAMHVALPVLLETRRVVELVATLCVLDVPSSYLSRGPPSL